MGKKYYLSTILLSSFLNIIPSHPCHSSDFVFSRKMTYDRSPLLDRPPLHTTVQSLPPPSCWLNVIPPFLVSGTPDFITNLIQVLLVWKGWSGLYEWGAVMHISIMRFTLLSRAGTEQTGAVEMRFYIFMFHLSLFAPAQMWPITEAFVLFQRGWIAWNQIILTPNKQWNTFRNASHWDANIRKANLLTTVEYVWIE